jgi:hypothetical protein
VGERQTLVVPLAYPKPPLADDLVSLRPWRLTDIETVIEASRDPYIPKVTSVPASFTRGAGERWLERQDARSRGGLGVSLAIAEPGGDEALGAVVLMHRGRGVYGLAPNASAVSEPTTCRYQKGPVSRPFLEAL